MGKIEVVYLIEWLPELFLKIYEIFWAPRTIDFCTLIWIFQNIKNTLYALIEIVSISFYKKMGRKNILIGKKDIVL